MVWTTTAGYDVDEFVRVTRHRERLTGVRPKDEQDLSVLESLYGLYGNSIFKFAYRSGLDRADAQDVVSDVFLIARRRLDVIPLAPWDKAWLFAVARRVIAAARRRRIRDFKLTERLHPRDGESDCSDPRREWIDQMLRELSKRDREIVSLIAWEGFSHDEAARILNCSPNASRLRYHKAKEKLRHRLEQDGGNLQRPSPVESGEVGCDG